MQENQESETADEITSGQDGRFRVKCCHCQVVLDIPPGVERAQCGACGKVDPTRRVCYGDSVESSYAICDGSASVFRCKHLTFCVW
jgi:hypothetical protein